MDKSDEYIREFEQWKAAQPKKPNLCDLIATRNPRLLLGLITAAARTGAAKAIQENERVRKVRDAAVEAYGGDADAAERFLRRKHLMLADVTPLQLAVESEEGAEKVINLIGRALYGGGV